MIREERTPNSSWWEDVQLHHHTDHANSISTSFYHNNNSKASCEGDDISISTVNASNRFDLTAESSNHHSLRAPNQPTSTSDELHRNHVVYSNNHHWGFLRMPGPGRSLGDQMGHHHHNHITSSKNKSSTAPELSFEPVCDNTNGNVGSTTQTKQALEVKNEEDLFYNNGLSCGPSLFHDAIESSRSFLDIRLSRPLTDTNLSFKPCFKALNLKEHQMASMAKCSGRSTRSTDKELPKAKFRDKITTLQQIVSPFGKTDTASVLQEAITCINFLSRESIGKMLYMHVKIRTIDHLIDPWGAWDREDHNKRGPKHIDLKSRGLSLVSISCTPIAYRDNSATDYWSPS
ncbi:unnamed protein product [Brassica rapa]|uniref:BHLH domain-containing protein n=1 Tax=Brassica campestris TaxID=3711 RepID=A0A8D9M5A4_BRACM|nr:unnamed protein product [Brassica rapa]